MTNIVKTNNQQLRLAPLSVGLLSTLRIALPMVPQSATNVEVIVTSGDTHNAYTATFDSTKNWWLCDIDASQFPETGKQKYEVAYKISGDQFWDGQGWIEIVNATTSGITPAPLPDPYRYVVVTVNGYGATEADGAVRIPKLNIGTEDPSETTGYIEGDQYFNRTSGAQWALCSVEGTLTWVKFEGDVRSVNGKIGDVSIGANDVGAYTKEETDEAVADALSGKVDNKDGIIKGSLSVGELDNQIVIQPGSINQTYLDDPVHGGIAVAVIKLPKKSGTFAIVSDIADAVKNKVGSFASVGGASATVENGVAKLSDFFTGSNSLLTGTIDARLPYPLYSVPSTGLLNDRAINTTSLASVTVPDNFTDLLIRASVTTSLPVTMPEAITKYGDAFPSEAGEYLITITKTGTAEAYVRTIKLEVAQ